MQRHPWFRILVIGKVERVRCAPDERLIRLLANARRWFDDLRSGRCRTIAEIARTEGHHAPEVSRFSVLHGLDHRENRRVRTKNLSLDAIH